MSQNPYQQHEDYGYGADDYDYPDPPRTSLLAIFSIICAIPCACLPIVGIVPGLLGVTLGAVSLGLIKRSNGRLSGRTPAVVGIFLGLLMVVLNVALLIGMTQAYTYYQNTMQPVAETFFVSASQGDYTKARSVLTTTADADVTDEKIASFIEAIEVNEGRITGVTANLAQVFESFADVYSSSRGGTVVGGNQSGSDAAPTPFRVDTDQGSFIGVAIFDGQSLGTSGGPKLVDVMALLPGPKAILLRNYGPGALEAAAAFGATVVTHEEAISGAAQGALPQGESTPPAQPDAPDTSSEEKGASESEG